MEKVELKDKLVSVNRITKVVKGGRRFAFSALGVVGNFEGSIFKDLKWGLSALGREIGIASRIYTYVLTL